MTLPKLGELPKQPQLSLPDWLVAVDTPDGLKLQARWRPVSEPPSHGDFVIVRDARCSFLGWYDSEDGWYVFEEPWGKIRLRGKSPDSILEWMPLPEVSP